MNRRQVSAEGNTSRNPLGARGGTDRRAPALDKRRPRCGTKGDLLPGRGRVNGHRRAVIPVSGDSPYKHGSGVSGQLTGHPRYICADNPHRIEDYLSSLMGEDHLCSNTCCSAVSNT